MPKETLESLGLARISGTWDCDIPPEVDEVDRAFRLTCLQYVNVFGTDLETTRLYRAWDPILERLVISLTRSPTLSAILGEDPGQADWIVGSAAAAAVDLVWKEGVWHYRSPFPWGGDTPLQGGHDEALNYVRGWW